MERREIRNVYHVRGQVDVSGAMVKATVPPAMGPERHSVRTARHAKEQGNVLSAKVQAIAVGATFHKESFA